MPQRVSALPGVAAKRLHGRAQPRERICAAVANSGAQEKSAPSEVARLAIECFLARQTGRKEEAGGVEMGRGITEGRAEMATAERLAQGFCDLVQNHKPGDLDT